MYPCAAALGAELYSSVLSGTVVDWGNESPGEEWTNANGEGEENGKSPPWVGSPCLQHAVAQGRLIFHSGGQPTFKAFHSTVWTACNGF